MSSSITMTSALPTVPTLPKAFDVSMDTHDDSGYGTQSVERTSPSINCSASNRGKRLTPPALASTKHLAQFDKSVDGATMARFDHIHRQVEKPLLAYMVRKLSVNKYLPIAVRLMILGTSEADAKPHIVVLCPEKQSRRVRKFFDKDTVKTLCKPGNADLPSFEVLVMGRPPVATQGNEDAEVFSPMEMAGYLDETYCGAPIITRQPSGVNKRSTLGGIVKVILPNGVAKLYGMTVGHVLLEDGLGDESSESFESELWLSESETSSCYSSEKELKDESQLSQSADDAQVRSTDAIEARASFTSAKLGSVWKDARQGGLSATPDEGKPKAYYDWALIEMLKYKPNRIPLRTLSSDEAAQDRHFVSEDLVMHTTSPHHSQNVIVMTGSEGLKRGVLSTLPSRLLLGPGQAFIETFIVNLVDGKQLLDGDSGSWVVNEKTLEVYGYIVASDTFHGGYVIPISTAFQDIKDRLGIPYIDLASTIDMASINLSHPPDGSSESIVAPATSIKAEVSFMPVMPTSVSAPSHYRDHKPGRGPEETLHIQAGTGPSQEQASAEDWEKFKTAIQTLYLEEGKPLNEVVTIITGEYNFHATPKMYKKRFSEWGWITSWGSQDGLFQSQKDTDTTDSGYSTFRAREAVAGDNSDKAVVTTSADLSDVQKALSEGYPAQLLGSMDEESLQNPQTEMADTFNMTLGTAALVTFALSSSEKLSNTIRSFESHNKQTHALLRELSDLKAVLESLSETINDCPNIDFKALKSPLERCGKACNEYGELIVRFTKHSTESRGGIRDWAKQKYLQGDMTDFRDMLSMYKSTISITIANVNIRVAAITPKVLEDYKAMMSDTKQDLEDQLEDIDEKIQGLSYGAPKSCDQSSVEWQTILEDKACIQKGLEFCAQLSAQIEERESTLKADDGASLAQKCMRHGLSATKGSIGTLKSQLHSVDDNIDRRISDMASTVPLTSERSKELAGLQETKKSLHDCIRLISDAGEDTGTIERHNIFEDITLADKSFSFTISTVGALVTARRLNLSCGSCMGGQISDAAFEKALETRAMGGREVKSQKSQMNEIPTPGEGRENREGNFQRRHGQGNVLAEARSKVVY